jgi:hypothetical protein
MSNVTPISQTATAAYSRVQSLSDYYRDVPRDKSRADLKDSSTRANYGPATRVTLSAAAHAAVSADRAERLNKAETDARAEKAQQKPPEKPAERAPERKPESFAQ